MNEAPADLPPHPSRYPPRQRVWIALADLFRDTETTPADIDFIAGALHEAGFDAAQARQILRDEVAPVFGWNMLAVAGNWTGWRDQEVVDQINAYLAKRDGVGLAAALMRLAPLRGLRQRAWSRVVDADWDRVAARLDRLHAAGR